jgi:hypothetical protein
MRYTAFGAILLGVVAGWYAGYQYASGGPPDQAEDPSTASLVIPLAFAALLVVGGVMLWVCAGIGFTGSKTSPVGSVVRGTKARR